MRTMAKRKPRGAANNWPERLRRLRDKRGWTQAQAAAHLHLSQSQWSQFESGVRKPTRPIAYLIELLESGII